MAGNNKLPGMNMIYFSSTVFCEVDGRDLRKLGMLWREDDVA